MPLESLYCDMLPGELVRFQFYYFDSGYKINLTVSEFDGREHVATLKGKTFRNWLLEGLRRQLQREMNAEKFA